MKRDGKALIALAKKLNPALDFIAEKPILNANEEKIGWHCYAYSKDGFSYSGGTPANVLADNTDDVNFVKAQVTAIAVLTATPTFLKKGPTPFPMER